MTNLLQQAFDAASKLPNPEQDALAAWIMAELESEAKWSQVLDRGQKALESLAKEALAEHARGETRELDLD